MYNGIMFDSFKSVSYLTSEAEALHDELEYRYYQVLKSCSLKLNIKTYNMLGFKYGFNGWVGLVLGLREATGTGSKALFMILDATQDDSIDSVFFEKLLLERGSKVSFQELFRVFQYNVALREYYSNAYVSGAGSKVEDACLSLLMSGFNAGKYGLEGFLECVAAGVNLRQVDDFLSLGREHRSAFYSGEVR